MTAVSPLPYLPAAAATPLGAEVARGLIARPKRLSPWLFYDERGSALFESITNLPEYYLTRIERDIFAEHGDAILAAAGDAGATIIELGAGTASKTDLLLAAAVRRHGPVTYYPMDIAPSALEQAGDRIARELPLVSVRPILRDYTRNLGELPGSRRLVLYIGSSIGNFDPAQARQLLHRVRASLRPGDGFLLGVDLVKERETLLAAYDDFAGVTADFNLNLLARLNRELGAEFTLDSFKHFAVWNETESRIEMHLESRIAQKVPIAALGLEVAFAQGETIHTENSYKYALGQAEAMMAEAGLAATESWTDERGWFNVCLGTAV